MPQSFNCPNCSAPLDVDGDGSATLRCPYCYTSVIIADELRVRQPAAQPAFPTVNTFNAPSLELHPPTLMQSTTLDPNAMRKLMEMVRSGDKIGAIKLFTYTTGSSLSDARAAIEGLEGALSAPGTESKSETSTGTSYSINEREITTLSRKST